MSMPSDRRGTRLPSRIPPWESLNRSGPLSFLTLHPVQKFHAFQDIERLPAGDDRLNFGMLRTAYRIRLPPKKVTEVARLGSGPGCGPSGSLPSCSSIVASQERHPLPCFQAKK